MNKDTKSGKRVKKQTHSNRKKRENRDQKEKKRSMQTSNTGAGSSASGAGASSQNEVYTEPGPHGSTSVKAKRGSAFLHARGASYAIREQAYMKEVFGASGEQTVVMNCQMSCGVLIRPNIRQAKFEYPDGTFMHCVPVCDVRVLAMSSVFRRGRGREYINSASEVYGRDSVSLVMRSRVVDKLKRCAARAYGRQYEKDRVMSFGEPDEDNPDVTVIPCAVRKHAKIVASVGGVAREKGLAKVVGWDNHDVVGDVVIALKYVREVDKRSAELVFELQDVFARRGAEKLFGGSSSRS